jgi:hypothetical protein
MSILQHPSISDPSRANILAALDIQLVNAERYGHEVMDPELFFPAGDEAQVAAAHAWWPRECPDNLSWATSLGGSIAMLASGANNETLVTHLMRQGERVATWLLSEGRDVVYPNESKSDRMKRLNRERVARHRAEQRSVPEGARPAASEAWDKVVAARRHRAEVLADHDAKVKAAYDVMTEAAEARKVAKAQEDELVAAAEAEHRALRTAS